MYATNNWASVISDINEEVYEAKFFHCTQFVRWALVGRNPGAGPPCHFSRVRHDEAD
jgi:hypothetical protein